MPPFEDLDALMLLAMMLAAKRRPAALTEVIAALDLLEGGLPPQVQIGKSFARLSEAGLLREQEGGFALNAAAESLLTGLKKKSDTMARIKVLRERLANHTQEVPATPIALTPKALGDAVLAFRTAEKSSKHTLLAERPQPAEADKRKPAPRSGKPQTAKRGAAKPAAAAAKPAPAVNQPATSEPPASVWATAKPRRRG